MVWAGIAYSQKRWYGKNSPLKVAQTFQISAWQYFTRPDFLYLVFALIGLPVFLVFAFKVMPMDPDMVWGYFVLFSFVMFFWIYNGIRHLRFQLHYWEHTKNMKIKAVPEEKVVLVSDGVRQLQLKKGDIKELYGVGMFWNSRGVTYSHYVYYLQDGSSFVLAEAMPGRWVLEDYLGYVEPQLIEKPWARIEHLPLVSVVAG